VKNIKINIHHNESEKMKCVKLEKLQG